MISYILAAALYFLIGFFVLLAKKKTIYSWLRLSYFNYIWVIIVWPWVLFI
jgi:hypothetical protein